MTRRDDETGALAGRPYTRTRREPTERVVVWGTPGGTRPGEGACGDATRRGGSGGRATTHSESVSLSIVISSRFSTQIGWRGRLFSRKFSSVSMRSV